MASSLSIRKGTTKTFLLSINNGSGEDSKTWNDLGTVLVRITQDDGTTIDKQGVILQDPTKLRVSYTQEETNRLTVKSNGYGKFKMQLFSIIGPEETEIAAKTDIYYGTVLPSLWSEVVHND